MSIARSLPRATQNRANLDLTCGQSMIRRPAGIEGPDSEADDRSRGA
jgi:hypothetical protein